MPLSKLVQFSQVVPLIPGSGIQMVDIGFSIDKNTPVPQDWGWFDPIDGLTSDRLPDCVRRGDAETRGVESYAIVLKDLLEMFDRQWIPLPIFRIQLAGGYFRGPINWARGMLVRLPAPDDDGNAFRLVIALDTALMDFDDDQAYLAPAPDDARVGRPFALAGHAAGAGWFYRQAWIRDWCFALYQEMADRQELARRGPIAARPLSIDEVHDTMQGSKEALARYMSLVDLLESLKIVPRFQFVDLQTDPVPTPVDVDLVLDLGNSRSCGLLIESEPDQINVDLTKAVTLQLRDLTFPERVYTDPFPSRFEFATARFGRDRLSFESGRTEAFVWPTHIRVGAEAVYLSTRRTGIEGSSGLSSPKRYLWDEDERKDSWRMSRPAQDGEPDEVAAQGRLAGLVNDQGEPIHRLIAAGVTGERLFPSLLARYSRRNLTAFALTEMFVQALVQVNSPMHRLHRPANARLPRRLRRIILTMPTAMPLAERNLLKEQAEIAAELAYLALGLARVEYEGEAAGSLVYEQQAAVVRNGTPGGPEVLLQWDEATATQAVYLYTQVAANYSGDANAFFADYRQARFAHRPAGAGGLRLATIDLGGGTTDLVITSLVAEGKGAHVTLKPEQIFREGFNLAGDDVLYRVAREHVVEPIRAALAEKGLKDRTDAVLMGLLGPDFSDMAPIALVRRQQFSALVAAPIAIALLQAYEAEEGTSAPLAQVRNFREFFTGDVTPPDRLIEHFNTEVRKLGAHDFDLAEVNFRIDPVDIDRTVRSVLFEMLQALAEVVHRCGADLLLLSGRTSKLPAVRALLEESGALPPNRIVSLHRFRVGRWYPFRSASSTIGDPKTTAAVGAMICLLGNGQLQNFNFRSDSLQPMSTARFFGKLDHANRLLAGDDFYQDLRLEDPEYELPTEPFEFRGPMALGFRQVPVDWWPASRLYFLDYRSPEYARELNPLTPLRVSLKRERRSTRAAGNTEVIRGDGLAIDSVEDANGRRVAAQKLRLRLQTMNDHQGYWLDTGVLFER